MWLGTRCVILLLAMLLLEMDVSNGKRTKSGKKRIFRMKKPLMIKRDGLQLPNLQDLMSMSNGEEGKYNYKGCEMEASSDMNKFTLNLKDKSCQNIMSIPRLFSKLTGKSLEDSKFFAPLGKFNVDTVSWNRDTKHVTFTASAKEQFQILPGTAIQVNKGKLKMELNYDGGFDFENLGFDISGEIEISTIPIVYSLTKKIKSKEGQFNLQTKILRVSDFYQAFAKGKESDEKTSALLDISLNQPRIIGVRDAKGNSELVVTGAATEIPGIGQGNLFIIVQVADGNSAAVAVIIKLMQIKPATIIYSLTGIDLKNVPIINDVTLDIIIEYANENIPMPQDAEMQKLLKQFSGTASIAKGTKIKFIVPFKELIEKNGVTVPADTNLNQYVNIIITDSKVSFEFPDNAVMDLVNILVAFIPKFASAAFEKVFKKAPMVKFSTFVVNVKTAEVDIVIETTAPFNIGKSFLNLESARFALKHKPDGPWEFSFDAETKIGDGTLKIGVKKEQNQYSFKGTIDQFTTADLIEKFNVKSAAAPLMKRISALNFGLKDVTISAEFGDRLKVKVIGEAVFVRWNAKFEGYIIDTVAGSRAMAFGLVVTNVGINDLAAEMFQKNGNTVDIINAKWMSQVTATITAANKAAKDEIDFVTPELKGNKERGPFSAAMPEGGVTFGVKIIIPEKCQDEAICEFVKKKIGAGQELILSGTVQPTGFSLTVGFQGNIQISEKFAIKQAKLMVEVDVNDGIEFAISGVMEVKLKSSKLLFTAKLAAGMTQVTLTLSMAGMWDNPFDLTNIKFGNFEMTAGFSLVTLLPTFVMAGTLYLGTGVNTIKADIAGGFESGVGGSFHFYVKFNKISIQSILDAFDVQMNVPKAIGNSGFPKGLTAGAAFPKGKKIKMLNVDLKPGFFLQGEFNFLGMEVFCDLEVNLPTKFHLKARFAKLELAGGAILLSNVARTSGPMLDVTLGLKTLNIKIDAYVEVLKIGIAAKIDISNKGIKFEVSGRFLDLFEATLLLTAPYGSLKDLPSTEWKVQSCISEYAIDKIKDGATSNVEESTNATISAQEDIKKRTEHAGSWFDIAMEKVNYWRKKLMKKEKKFKKEISKLEESKKDLDKSCVAECEKEKVWVGGFAEKTCTVAGKKIQCPYWNPEKMMRDSPFCLAECESSISSFFSKVVGFFDSGELILMEKKMEFYATMLNKVESFFSSSRALIEYVEQATEKVGELAAMGADALAAIRKFTAKHILYVHKICIQSSMEKASKGLCFSIDAEFYIGGKSGKKIELKNEEGCFNMDFAKEIGMKIAKAAFPGIETLKEKFSQVKDLFSKSDKESEDLNEKSADVEKETKARKRTIENTRLLHYRSDEILNSIPDHVIRNDDTIRAFRDLFLNDDDDEHIVLDITADEVSADNDDVMTSKIDLDPKSLSNSDESHKCKRTHDVINVYADVLETINFLAGKNKVVKDSYQTFVEDYIVRFDELGKQILNDSLANQMNANQTDDAMFYVYKAKDGIARWKTSYESKFNVLDKTSLKRWRGLMAEFVADKRIDIASFIQILSTASKETAKRMEIPSGKNDFEQSLNRAEKVVKSLLSNDDATLSSKQSNIDMLARDVKTLVALKKEFKCET